MKVFSLVISLFLLVSCGELTGKSTGANIVETETLKVGGLEALEISSNTYRLSGTASNGGNSGHRFDFSLNLEVGQSVELVFFANTKLEGGANLKFKREADSYKVMLSLNGVSLSHSLENLNDLENPSFVMDFHNDHEDAHILLWEESAGRGTSMDCSYSISNGGDGSCLLNSEDFAFDQWLSPGKAKGTFWGIIGNKEKVKAVEGPMEAVTDV